MEFSVISGLMLHKLVTNREKADALPQGVAHICIISDLLLLLEALKKRGESPSSEELNASEFSRAITMEAFVSLHLDSYALLTGLFDKTPISITLAPEVVTATHPGDSIREAVVRDFNMSYGESLIGCKEDYA